VGKLSWPCTEHWRTLRRCAPWQPQISTRSLGGVRESVGHVRARLTVCLRKGRQRKWSASTRNGQMGSQLVDTMRHQHTLTESLELIASGALDVAQEGAQHLGLKRSARLAGAGSNWLAIHAHRHHLEAARSANVQTFLDT
jgi:hypothetical protein